MDSLRAWHALLSYFSFEQHRLQKQRLSWTTFLQSPAAWVAAPPLALLRGHIPWSGSRQGVQTQPQLGTAWVEGRARDLDRPHSAFNGLR